MQELYLDEAQFHEFIINRISQEGYLSRVFLPFVSYNTALYLIKNLWSSKYQYFKENSKMPFYTASEKGWRGDLKNLKTSIDFNDSSFYYRIKGEKNFAIKDEDLILLAIDNNMPTFIHTHPKRIKTWIKKEDDFFLSENNKNFPYLNPMTVPFSLDHYNIEFDFKISSQNDDIKLVPKRIYQKYAFTVRIREYSSFSLAAYGMLVFLGSQTSMLQEKKNKIIEYRKNSKQNDKKQKMEIISDAKFILNFLYDFAKNESIKLHPLWFAPKNFIKEK